MGKMILIDGKPIYQILYEGEKSKKWKNMTIDEISKYLCVSHTTVLRHIQLCRKKYRIYVEYNNTSYKEKIQKK